MRVLIVEDQATTRHYLKLGLEQAGFRVDAAADGAEGLQLALDEHYDVIVLDVMLPLLDGWQVLRQLRGAGRDVPVLFLTAREAIDDRVKGLELGADDYLVKPFAFTELLARLRARLRRDQPTQIVDHLNVAELHLDVLRRRATRAGRRIELTPKEFALLELLMRRRGEVIPRLQIASEIWDINFDSGTNVVDVAVSRLRSKVDDGFDVKLIRTVRGVGYVLDVPEA
ncbi:heavy metal response regulator transcription factor [Thiomonas sp. FB-Cd]|uniref:heavy metal response regulator transcription factor n=1 Tax=Thiomonas sp. FB-Cd TaxID=1158292 RepID=UPI0004DF25D8|nr:heavy metal response regulator transcription factor [Thiomonas sp. FB-Cd]